MRLLPDADMYGSGTAFAATLMFANGPEIMTPVCWTARRTFVIGPPFMCGPAIGSSRRFAQFQGGSAGAGDFVVLGPVMALRRTNRLGVRKTQKMVGANSYRSRGNRSAWRRVAQSGCAATGLSGEFDFAVDRSHRGNDPQGPLEIEATFDEFNLDLRVSYAGPPLELPEKRPSNEEIMASEEGQRRLAGFMLRRYADRVRGTHRAGRSTILFHFDH
jgi:NCS2 family nucleobase:cation symporter-2